MPSATLRHAALMLRHAVAMPPALMMLMPRDIAASWLLLFAAAAVSLMPLLILR